MAPAKNHRFNKRRRACSRPQILKTMTNKKKYLIIAACCILAGVWFNHEDATLGEWIASLLSVLAAGVACYRVHLEDEKTEKHHTTPSTPNK